MMFRSVFSKTLYDKRWFMFGWTLGCLALLTLTAAFFPIIKDSGTEQLLKAIPPAMKNMIGNVSDYSRFDGYLGSAVFGLRSEMLFVPLAIILGSALGVREEASSRLYQLLAQPVSRFSVTLQKWLAAFVIFIVIDTMIYLGIVIVALIIGETVPWTLLNEVTVMSLLLLMALFSVTYGIGVAFGRKNIATMVPIVWVMLSFLVESFGPQIDWLGKLEPFSLLTYYNTSNLLADGMNSLHVGVLIGLCVLSLVTALLFFSRRDLRESD